MPDTEVEKRTYEIELTRGRIIRVTIPATYKVTYGPAIGAAGKAAYGSGMVFRVWETDKLQRGLWTDVVSFRDISLPIQVKAVRYFGKDQWLVDDGSYTNGKAALVERAWKDESDITFDPAPEDTEDDDGPKRLIGMAPRKNREF